MKREVKFGEIVGVNGDGTYRVKFNGSEHPIERVPPIGGARHHVGQSVPVDVTDMQAAQILAPRGSLRWVSAWKSRVASLWSTYGSTGQRRFANVESSVPSTLVEDSAWSGYAIDGGQQLMSVDNFVYMAGVSDKRRINIDTGSVTGLDASPQMVDARGYYAVAAGGTIQRRTHTDEVLWTSEVVSVNAGGPGASWAMSTDGSLLVIGGQRTDGKIGLTALSTADGSIVWTAPNVYPSVGGLVTPDLDDRTWMCCSGDTIHVRYAVPGGTIQRTYNNPLSGETAVVDIGTELRIHVRVFGVAYGNMVGDGELPIVSDTGVSMGGTPFTRGACFTQGLDNTDSAYQFIVCSSSFGQFEQLHPGGQFPEMQGVKIRRSINLCVVRGYDVEIHELDSCEDWRGHNADTLTARLRWYHVVGHDPTSGTTLVWAPWSPGGDRLLRYNSDGTGYYSDALPELPSVVSGIGGVIVADPTGDRGLISIVTVKWSITWPFHDTWYRLPDPIAIGSGSRAVLGQINIPEPSMAVIDVTTGEVLVTLTHAAAFGPMIVHGERIYASGIAAGGGTRLYRF